MRYIAFAYNLYTLAHVLAYADKEWGKENVDIVYSDIATPVPRTIINDYNIRFVPANDVLTRRRLDAIICSCKLSVLLWKTIDKLISNKNDQVTLVIFRDNEVEEATIIENAIRKYKDKTTICLIEEGTGIYAKSKPPIRYRFIKRVLYWLYRVSGYPLKNLPQGMHPSVDCIFCSNPDLMKEKRVENTNISIKKIRNVFNKELNDYLIQSVCGTRKSEKKYKFVFLTQPFDMFRDEYENLLITHNRLLPEVFRVLSEKGNLIIKLHPRETYDYQKYKNDCIDISSEHEKILPFQCLMQYYDFPQMVSMFSSASVGICPNKPSIYLFKIFKIPGIENLFNDKFYKDNSIIACESIKELESIITG